MDSDEVTMALLWSLYGVGMVWQAEKQRAQG